MESPSVSPALDPEHMREVVQRCLVKTDPSSPRVLECRIANTRRRDGSRGAVEYMVRLEDPATGQAWEQQVTGVSFGGGRTRRVWETISRTRAERQEAEMASGLAPFAYDPDLDMLLQVFPHDHRLPGLAQLVHGPPPDLELALLARFGPGEWRLESWQAETIQYRVDMRAILKVTVKASESLHGATAARHFFAKVYREAEIGQRAYTVQRSIADRATQAGGRIAAANPITYLEGMHTLVTEALPGVSLSRLIRRNDSLEQAVRAAARASAAFHQLDVPAPTRPWPDELARLRESAALLDAVRPDLTSLVSGMVETISNVLAQAPAALIHGDLKPDHLLIDGDRVSFIDFDLVAMADPVLDVAHMIAFLGRPQERARTRREPEGNAAEIFVDEYFAHASASGRARLPAYHAMTSIHKAVGLSQRRGADGQNRLEGVLREGEAMLTGNDDGAIPSFKRRITRGPVRSP